MARAGGRRDALPVVLDSTTSPPSCSRPTPACSARARATQLLVEDARGAACASRRGRVTPDAAPGADVVIWACGPWLAGLFPDHVDLKITRRDVFFFGGDAAWQRHAGVLRVRRRRYYGHGDIAGLGVKVAPDVPGDEVDPDTLDASPLPARER